jgi:hypothetical protein
MPSRKLANSTPTILRCLKTARDEWKRTAAPDRAINADQWAQLDDTNPKGLLNLMLTANGGVDSALAAQTAATSKLTDASGRLGMFCSHFHQALDNGIARGLFSPSDRNYYERPATATAIPVLQAQDDIAETAELIVTGEAARAKAAPPGKPLTMDSGVKFDSGVKWDSTTGGFVPMAMPSADEVGALLTQFQSATTTSDQALVATDTAREALAVIYPDALALAVDICDTVEYFYRKDPDDSSRRAKCERWGVVYVFDETVVPPTPPPTPVTAPPAR